jgi:hypothetical protein
MWNLSTHHVVSTDRATAHTARASMAVVRDMFPAHVISQCSDLPCPAQSPDLSVWDYLKAKVFINRPRTVHDPKVAIEHEIVAITPDMVRCSMNNFKTRLQECARRDGNHLDGIIFKTK